MKNHTKKQGINAALSRSKAGDIFWIENDGKPLTGHVRTGAKLTQEGFWGVNKQTGEVVPLLRLIIHAGGNQPSRPVPSADFSHVSPAYLVNRLRDVAREMEQLGEELKHGSTLYAALTPALGKGGEMCGAAGFARDWAQGIEDAMKEAQP